jgi:hypothetical protein
MKTDLVSATVYFGHFDFSGDRTIGRTMEESFPKYQRRRIEGLWDHPQLFITFRVLFPLDKATESVTLTTHHHLVPKLKIKGLTFQLPHIH